MSGYLPLAAGEPDEAAQVVRLARFRQAHPGVIIGSAGFGAWQGIIRGERGEAIAIRYTLRELLDRLGELIRERDGRPGPPG